MTNQYIASAERSMKRGIANGVLAAAGLSELPMEKPRLYPAGDRVLVLPDREAEVSKGGIHLPDGAHREGASRTGKVVAVGPGPRLTDGRRGEMFYAVGDRVLFNRYAGLEVELGETKHLLMSENEVVAKLE